ncbi:MAG: prepilin-type N-terminal cleavage/methylation domain-containing protein, partial [Candidatus Omnitrophica bacterium]|nr:prepilin-type N-terminal cleavage/methylation domain-containing protein [Candidatus Omnitrophota bacterium]
MKNHGRGDAGFTLIELMMVIVIIAILAVISMPRFVDLSQSAREAAT